ncbi:MULTISPECIES: TetR/AcrR family transcriptional regulator [unclassified Microbacterium]|uniref:TetR/AcrR family transcriptional regulator n=1 Tax=unclassified Microbacterium TaxID=2609290 RepID=UPI00109C8D14|nr:MULTISPECIES: TetR family transcriptional regulator [unclassified Microbacterium]
MTKSPRSVGRPSTQVLTEERILKAAFRLSAQRTPRQFTMTALAESLGVRTSALYHHFANRDAVIRAMRGQVSRALVSPVLHEMPIDDALLTWAHSYREAAIRAPEAMVMLATSPIDADEASFADYEQIARLLTDDGWPTDTIVDAIVALEAFIIGSALDALAPADNMAPGELAPTYPTFAEAESARARLSSDPARRTFEIGVRALIHGLTSWARERTT